MQELSGEPLIYTINANLFAYLTHTELVVWEMGKDSKRSILRVEGNRILALSLENPRFLILLMDTGQLQVRRADCLTELFLKVDNLPVVEDIPSLRISQTAVYIISAQGVERVQLKQPARREVIYVSEDMKDFVVDFLVSSTLPNDKLLIYHLPTAVSLTIDGLPVARMPFRDVQQIKLLRHPTIPHSKQYMAVIDCSRYLKIYDLATLKQVAEKEFVMEKNEELEINVEWNNEYLVMRVYEIMGMKTKRNTLLRINANFYLGSSKGEFFVVESPIAVCEDLLIFPIQRVVVQSVEYDAINACYFLGKNIKIITVMINRTQKMKVNQLKTGAWENSGNQDWTNILASFKSIQPNKKKRGKQEGKSDEWDRFVAKFVHENTAKFKQQQQCLQKGSQPKQKQQLQDALNTLSGSSYQNTHEIEQRLLKIMESSLPPLDSQENLPIAESQPIAENDEELSNESQTEIYLAKIEDDITATTQNIQVKGKQLKTKMGRFEQVHLRKIRGLNRTVKGYAGEAKTLTNQIEEWCGQQMEVFGAELKESLKQFTANVGRLEMLGLGNLKKLRRGYRDYLQEAVELCQQKLQRSETSTSKIQALIIKLESF